MGQRGILEAVVQQDRLRPGRDRRPRPLRAVAGDFLAEVFQESRYEDRQLLRGVYFTSGTQEGTPIDRLMSGMARIFGIGRQAVGAGRGTGRSYFLTGLLQRVVFPEAGLVSADDRVERRYRLVRAGAIAAAVLVALGLGALWTRSFVGNSALVAEAEAQVAAYRAACAAGDDVVTRAGLDALTAVPVDDRPLSVRWVVAHMTSETARHAGHADVVRELIDGTTGR